MSNKAFTVMKLIGIEDDFKFGDRRIRNPIGIMLVYDDHRIAERENPGYEIKEIELWEEEMVQ